MSVYQGHLADGSSVQRHSAGGLYPFIIYFRDATGYGVLTPAGNEIACGTHSQAITKALELKTGGAHREAERSYWATRH